MAVDVEKLQFLLEVQGQKFESQLKRQNAQAYRIFKSLEDRASAMEKSVGGSLSALGKRIAGVFAGVAVGSALNDIRRFADSYLSNAYNKVERFIYRNATGNWTYNFATPRIAGGDTNNMVQIAICLPGTSVECRTASRMSSSTSTIRSGRTGVGLNQYSAYTDTRTATYAYGHDGFGTRPAVGHPTAETTLYPSIGFNFVAWLESGEGADTQTFWAGDNLTGLSGTIWG